MKGHPVREWGLFSLVWLVLALPVWMLTNTGGAPAARPLDHADVHDTPSTMHAYAELRFTRTPERVVIRQRGEVVWEVKAPRETELAEDVQLQWEGDHIELAVLAEWSGDGVQVLELTLMPDALEAQTHHAWSAEGSLDDIFVYHWHEEGSH